MSNYSREFHAAYMREWRARNKLTEEQRYKDNARSYAGTYKHIGKLIQKDCENCGKEETEMHHEDYSKPLDVTWLCRDYHLTLHKPDYRSFKYWERIGNMSRGKKDV